MEARFCESHIAKDLASPEMLMGSGLYGDHKLHKPCIEDFKGSLLDLSDRLIL